MKPLRPLSIETAIALSPITPYRAAAHPPRRLLLVGHNGVDNLGADLRTELALRMLRAADPGLELWMTTYDPARTGGGFAGARQCLLPRDGGAELWRLVSLCDAVIVTEGCALSEAGFAQFAGALALARSQRKPAIAWAVGADRMPAGAARWLQRHCAGTLFLCRDGRSMAALAEAGLDARPGTDPVWDAVDVEPATAPTRRSGIVICASSPEAWPAAHRQRFDGWIATLDRLVSSAGEEVVLLSLDGADTPHAERLAARTGARCAQVASLESAGAALGSARVAVSARFHGFVLGAVHGARPVGVAFDSRLPALVAGSPMAGSVLDGTAPELARQLASLVADRDRCAALAPFVAAARAAVPRMNVAALDHLALAASGKVP
jgi:polysaccharide pyruvyl transferase WcaK-like protein